MSLAANETLQLLCTSIVDEFLIGTGDIDVTVDSFTSGASGRTIGPLKGFLVLSGSGSLVYVDQGGVTRTLTGLATGQAAFGPVSIVKINGTANAKPSAALTLRGAW